MATIYYEDCLALEQKCPEIHASFLKGDFVVQHSCEKGSTVPRDQAFEKAYSKPAKSQSGIIGISRRKKAVAKWNIIKQDKCKFETFLYELSSLDEEDKYSLRHEFSKAVTDTDTHCISLVIDYIMNRIEETHSSFRQQRSSKYC